MLLDFNEFTLPVYCHRRKKTRNTRKRGIADTTLDGKDGHSKTKPENLELEVMENSKDLNRKFESFIYSYNYSR